MNCFSFQFKSRGAGILGLTLLWALLYLPCLGTNEIQGEEGRRALPAMAMIKGGDWIVPDVGGEAYAKKPPLLNWCIALSIRATGVVNCWSMRLPSAVSALVLALGGFLLLWRFLGATGAWLTGIFLLVNATMLEKGRLGELEALTVACFGLAFLVWFYGEVYSLRNWHWIGSGFFLGLGFMTKGPLPMLLFYYLFVGLTLWQTKRLRELLSPGHIVAVLLTWGPLVLWGYEMMHRLGADNISGVWMEQMSKRATPGAAFGIGNYLEEIARSLLLNFAPWILLAPLLWNKAALAALPDIERTKLRAMRLAFVIGLLVIALMPGGRARYSQPLVVPFMVLLAWVLVRAGSTFTFPWWQRALRIVVVVAAIAAPVVAVRLHATGSEWLLVAVIIAGALIVWSGKTANLSDLVNASAVATVILGGVYVLVLLALPDRVKAPELLKADQIAAALPTDVPLYAVNAGSERILVHLGLRVNYLTNLANLPAGRPLFITAITTNEAAILAAKPKATKVVAVTSHNGNTIQVLRLD